MENYFEVWWSLTEQTYALIWPEAIIAAVALGLVWAYIRKNLRP